MEEAQKETIRDMMICKVLERGLELGLLSSEDMDNQVEALSTMRLALEDGELMGRLGISQDEAEDLHYDAGQLAR